MTHTLLGVTLTKLKIIIVFPSSELGSTKYVTSTRTADSWRGEQVCADDKTKKQTNKQTPWPLVRERTIPTERPPLVDEI
jgi:hypothetical protein